MKSDIDISPIFAESKSFEAGRTEMLERSEKRAWIVAMGLGACLFMACAAIFMMSPLKETEPFVVRVDNATGVPDIVTAMKDQVTTGDEIMDKYWLARYITHRETYDWHTIQTDYDTVGLMSSADVGAEYAAQFEGDKALQEEYGDRVKASIKVVNVVPTGEGTGAVRFIKTTKRIKTGAVIGETRWLASVAFEYESGRIKESTRLVNPFGFRVTSYRVDEELAGGD